MTIILENLNGIAGMGVGIALMTVVGQAVGAGRKEEAKYYILKLTWYAELVVFVSCVVIRLVTVPVTHFANMEEESIRQVIFMMNWITLIKPLVWVLAFVPGYGLRAAGHDPLDNHHVGLPRGSRHLPHPVRRFWSHCCVDRTDERLVLTRHLLFRKIYIR